MKMFKATSNYTPPGQRGSLGGGAASKNKSALAKGVAGVARKIAAKGGMAKRSPAASAKPAPKKRTMLNKRTVRNNPELAKKAAATLGWGGGSSKGGNK